MIPQSSIKIFIGSEASQRLAAKVLIYTLQKHSSQPLDVHVMDCCPIPEILNEIKAYQGTEFSFYRFAIPELMNYAGKAIYLDADMQVFSDICEIWNTPMENYGLLCSYSSEPPAEWRAYPQFQNGRQMSVLLLDCSRLNWNLRQIVHDLQTQKISYAKLMSGSWVSNANDSLGEEWNHLEKYIPEKTKLLHYTVGNCQPWLNNRNSLNEVWMKDFREALKAGAISKKDVLESVREGNGKLDLLKEIESFTGMDRFTVSFLHFMNRFLRRMCKIFSKRQHSRL